MKEVRSGIPETETLKKSGSAVEQALPLRETKEMQHGRLFQSLPTKEDRAGREAYAGSEAVSGVFDDLKSDRQPYSQQKEKKDQPAQEKPSAQEKPYKPYIYTRERLDWVRTKAGLKPLTDQEWEKENAARNSPEAIEERQKWNEESDRLRKLSPEERWEEILTNIQGWRKQRQREQREKAAWMHERDPRYDPMTGDLLEPGDSPLDPKCEYTFDGKTRARSFVHPEARSLLSPDKALLEFRKPLQADGKEEEPEIPSHERLIQRLLKAGFVEVEPTLRDKASFERTQWYLSLSPSEKMAYLDEEMRKMREGSGEYLREAGIKDETAGEIVAKVISALFALILALISPSVEENRDQPVPQPA